MNFRTTWILVILVLVLGGLWLLDQSRNPGGAASSVDENEPPKPKKAFDPSPAADDVQAVVVSRPDKPDLRFTRADGKEWQMVLPLAGDVERYMVTSGLINKCINMEQTREYANVAPADAGLEPPSATIRLEVGQAGSEATSQAASAPLRTYLVELGKRVPVSNEHYVRVTPPGGTARTIGTLSDFTTEMGRDAKDYRAKSLLKLPVATAIGLDITHEGKRYALARAAAAAQWTLEEPVRALAEDAKINALVSTLGALRVNEFIDDAPSDLGRYGLADPWMSVSLTTEREDQPEPPASQPATDAAGPPTMVRETRGLLVGEFADLKKSARYVKLTDQPWVASVPATSIDSLIPKPAEWRDTRVARFDPADVTRVEVSVADETAVLNRTDAGWAGEGDLATPDAAAVEALLAGVSELRAIDFVDTPESPDAHGLAAPRATLTLTRRGQVEPLVVRIGGETPSGRNAYAAVSGQGSVFVIAAEKADRLAVSPLALRSAEIFTFAPNRLTSASMTGPNGARAAKRDGMLWKLTEPADAPSDATALLDLANDLSALRARRVADKGNFEQYGLAEPLARIEFEVAPPPRPPTSQPASDAASQEAATPQPEESPTRYVLSLGKSGDTLYARRGEEPYVYELDPTVEPVLLGEWIDRQLLKITPDDVQAISVSGAGGELAFERVDGTWKYAADPYVKLQQPVVNELLSGVCNVRVQSYQAWQGGDPATGGLESPGMTVVVRPKSGEPITLRIAAQGDVTRRPAAWVEAGRLFTIDLSGLTALSYPLEQFVAPEEPTDDDGAPPMP